MLIFSLSSCVELVINFKRLANIMVTDKQLLKTNWVWFIFKIKLSKLKKKTSSLLKIELYKYILNDVIEICIVRWIIMFSLYSKKLNTMPNVKLFLFLPVSWQLAVEFA